jgi:pantoate--beta-alanine ligase
VQILRTIASLREWREQQRVDHKRVGLVPTMGYLHQGHLSLVEEAKLRTETVIMSIFVNPLQFGPNEDLSRYPRDEVRDLAMAESAGVDAVFLPSVEAMYPQSPRTKVVVSGVTEGLCGASRPGHFDGVAFVVLKLFQLTQPDVACFGLKDAQQVAVIRQMVDDLAVPVEIIACPIVREADGLALSSRNVYLTDEQREQALILSKALGAARKMFAQQATQPINSVIRREAMTVKQWLEQVRAMIQTVPLAEIDYIELRTFPSWVEPDEMTLLQQVHVQDLLLAVAVRFGRTRLIDNLILHAFEGRDNNV